MSVGTDTPTSDREHSGSTSRAGRFGEANVIPG